MTVLALSKFTGDAPDWLRRRDLACIGHWDPYDYLITFESGAGWLFALNEAWGMCLSCPVIAQCHQYNAGEQWLKVMKAYPPALHQVRPRKKKKTS